MPVEIAAPPVNHERISARSRHRCEPRIKLECCACRREFVFCTATRTSIKRSMARQWRCSECNGGEGSMNAIASMCPDPRGPMVDRPDYVEGQLDALRDILAVFENRLEVHLHDAEMLEVRKSLDANNDDSNTPLQQFAAELDLGAILLGETLHEAITQARWKLARVTKAKVPA